MIMSSIYVVPLRYLPICVLIFGFFGVVRSRNIVTRSTDYSVKGYLTERICWWNEVCKEEFRSQFRCKCPEWSFCRAPGRYYNAFCSMTTTGYIWSQPGLREKLQSAYVVENVIYKEVYLTLIFDSIERSAFVAQLERAYAENRRC